MMTSIFKVNLEYLELIFKYLKYLLEILTNYTVCSLDIFCIKMFKYISKSIQKPARVNFKDRQTFFN